MVVFSIKCLTQVTLNKFQINSNYFDPIYSEAISSYFGLTWAISLYLSGLYQVNSSYLGLSGLPSINNYYQVSINCKISIIKYQWSSIKYQVSSIKYQGVDAPTVSLNQWTHGGGVPTLHNAKCIMYNHSSCMKLDKVFSH